MKDLNFYRKFQISSLSQSPGDICQPRVYLHIALSRNVFFSNNPRKSMHLSASGPVFRLHSRKCDICIVQLSACDGGRETPGSQYSYCVGNIFVGNC